MTRGTNSCFEYTGCCNHPFQWCHCWDKWRHKPADYSGSASCTAKCMLGGITVCGNIYIACGYTDMRKSIDGLAAIVQEKFHLNLFFVKCYFLKSALKFPVFRMGIPSFWQDFMVRWELSVSWGHVSYDNFFLLEYYVAAEPPVRCDRIFKLPPTVLTNLAAIFASK